MATLAQTLINRVRTYIRDWPPISDVTTAALTDTTGTTVTVADTTIYSVNSVIQIDTEAMVVVALATGTTLTVRRGQRGTTAATHLISATVLLRPSFLDNEILDRINAGMDACYPYVYRDVQDTSLTVISNQYEYAVPTLTISGGPVPIPRIWKVETQTPGDTAFRKVTDWLIAPGASPTLKFKEVPYPSSVIRISGYAPFTHMAATDSLDAQFPASAHNLPVLYATSELLASGEAGRTRMTSGAVDDREQAQRLGGSLAAGSNMLQRFQAALLNGGHCAPMQSHIVVSY